MLNTICSYEMCYYMFIITFCFVKEYRGMMLLDNSSPFTIKMSYTSMCKCCEYLYENKVI